jgi:hypothetical protein
MSQGQRCRCCGEPFVPRPQNPTQSYCAQRACQRARKREWQRAKRAVDPDYRANDQAARRAWAQAHPEYWRAWRADHPEYVQRNRRAQAGRNARRRAGVIAKEDAWTCESPVAAGTYRVEPWFGGDCKCGRVKVRNLFVLSPFTPPGVCLVGDCKERT